MCVGIGISNAPTIMSRVGGEEEEDEEACFHECLDRILSSSSSSTSSAAASDVDDDDASSPTRVSVNQKHRHHHISFPTFPVSVSKYDVWVSQPSSVEERRSRLLREMGLAFPEFLRSAASSDHLRPSVSGMVRPKSDSAAGCTSSLPPDRHHCNLSSVSNSILSIRPLNNRSTDLLYPPTGCGCGCGCGCCGGDGCTPPSTSATSSKPPMGKKCREVHDVRRESYNSNSNPSFNCDSNSSSLGSSAGGGELLEDNPDSNGSDPDQPRKHVCRIKNLDNGKEFVVNEVREDGMWNMLKEVGSERQLTMEEFEMWVGPSPWVRNLMRRQNFDDGSRDKIDESAASGSRLKKKGGWLKSIKTVASSVTGGYKERRSSDERDTSSEKGGRRSSSATDDSQDVFFHGPERIKVKQYGKSCKELSGVFKTQEFQAHVGSIRSIKFSLDGMYLASAGEDRVIHVWKVVETERKGEMLMEKMDDVNFPMFWANGSSPETTSMLLGTDNSFEKKKRGKTSLGRKSVSLDHVVVPETVFALDEKPLRSFQGHLDDVLDLSWSKSQHLLSSSMDKTVRLWHLQKKSCLKVFSHSDYVTCIQFNPVDDNYFISGSVDEKVRIWSIPDRQVVDYEDLHEMVTAASYTPDGQGALVGSYEGSCRLYDTSENKLRSVNEIQLHNRKKAHHKKITGFPFTPGSEIHPHNRKKKTRHKKITGFQFAPGSASEVLITSADSRVRIVEGSNLTHKFKGFRNAKSQISASLTANGRYVICASEDSHVYVWKYDGSARTITSKNVVTATRSYECFQSRDVSVAIPWPGTSGLWDLGDLCSEGSPGFASRADDEVPAVDHPPTPVEHVCGDDDDAASLSLLSGHAGSPLHGIISSASNSYLFDRISQTCPEEKLVLGSKNPSIGVTQNRSAWGLAIVTAGLGGEIRTFQNFGLPVQI